MLVSYDDNYDTISASICFPYVAQHKNRSTIDLQCFNKENKTIFNSVCNLSSCTKKFLA